MLDTVLYLTEPAQTEESIRWDNFADLVLGKEITPEEDTASEVQLVAAVIVLVGLAGYYAYGALNSYFNSNNEENTVLAGQQVDEVVVAA